MLTSSHHCNLSLPGFLTVHPSEYEVWALLFKVHSDNVWLLTGMISSLKFNMIFDVVGFKSASLLFIFSLLSLFCAPLFLIFCLLLDFLNIFLKIHFNYLCLLAVSPYLTLVAQMVRICPQCRRPAFDPWVRKIPWRRKW